jgi:hypothetical protein
MESIIDSVRPERGYSLRHRRGVHDVTGLKFPLVRASASIERLDVAVCCRSETMPSDYGSPRKPHGRLAETRTGFLPETDCPRVLPNPAT